MREESGPEGEPETREMGLGPGQGQVSWGEVGDGTEVGLSHSPLPWRQQQRVTPMMSIRRVMAAAATPATIRTVGSKSTGRRRGVSVFVLKILFISS